MQAYEGYWENGQFYPLYETEKAPGRMRAFLTILDEPAKQPIQKDTSAFWEEHRRLAAESAREDKELRSKWLDRLHDAVDASLGEELPDLERSTVMREPVDLKD